ncbi:hypothetical protein PoB_004553900 [Plakobranchus ocellatus]|uniref:Uncharacterized protein n=1 Tax=Plakobranchus ocellatus TaxID=259542 RepID=A0AAV4BL43_9GAST|nr:hypothetical protein PoB_004553900 [Plakobranchus ocellatus]
MKSRDIHFLNGAIDLSFLFRLHWIEILDKQATEVQSLLSSMSAIFDKFAHFEDLTIKRSPSSTPRPSVNDEPVNVILTEVRNVLDKQARLINDLRK